MRTWTALRTSLVLAGGLAAAVAFTHCAGRPLPEDIAADLIFYNGKIITVDANFSIASALAVKDDKFLTLGPDNDILSWAGSSTRTVDLQGKTVTPGFIDAHIHAIRASGNTVSLEETRSVAEILEVFREKVQQTPEKTWIGAFPFMSVDQIEEGRSPHSLGARFSFPQSPRFHLLSRPFSGHQQSCLARSRYWPRTTPQKWVIKDPDTGEPNGWLLEDLGGRILRFFPRGGLEETMKEVRRMSRDLNAVGITGVIQQLGGTTTGRNFRALEQLRKEGELTLRWRLNYSLPPATPDDRIQEAIGNLGPPTGYGNEWLRIGGLGELSLDGWWEPMDTAYLREPYEGSYSRQQGKGDLRFSIDRLRAICLAAAQNDIQMSVHVAGSAALDEVLNVYDEVDQLYPIASKRWTLEHGGFLPTPRNLEQAKRLGVIVSTQQSNSYFVPRALREMLGERRASSLFPNRTWLEGGIMVAGGSDFPGSPLSPLLGMYASVTRKTAIGELGPEEAISRQEALKLYTTYAAHISFEEDLKGSIEPGKLADFVVLSDDLLTVPEENIKDIEVLMTVVGGKVV